MDVADQLVATCPEEGQAAGNTGLAAAVGSPHIHTYSDEIVPAAPMKILRLSACSLLTAFCGQVQAQDFRIPPATAALLENHCADCHDEDSQKGDVRWDRMAQIAEAWLPTPRILHPWPEQRFAVKHPR